MAKTIDEFINLVQKMREAQRVHVRQGGMTNHRAANVLEKRVDDFIKLFNKTREEENQPGLGIEK